MKIAVEGCAHGELDKIYEALLYLQQSNDVKIDLLICCGDFQAVRNREDLQCMAVPPKYLNMSTFYKYYSGEAEAPILTVFIGGNHEASNYLGELAYGGWVCPNIYYLGYSGIINVNGVRIAGLSGIYNGPDYLKGRFEKPPYDASTKRSTYHIRSIDTFRLKQIREPIDVFLSHDWPRGVYNYGNVDDLLRKKRFFREEVESNKLGSRPNQELLEKLRPSYWFAAHLHVKFAALVPHRQGEGGGQRKSTKFLALDKCLPRRDFLQILDIGPEVSSDAPLRLHYDAEWLAILKSTDHLLNTSKNIRYMPGPGSSGRWDFSATADELRQVAMLFEEDLEIPLNFRRTASTYDPVSEGQQQRPKPAGQPPARVNPQTTELCDKLGITDPFRQLLTDGQAEVDVITAASFIGEGELNVTSGDDDVSKGSQSTTNPDEISLDDDEDDHCPLSPIPVGVKGLEDPEAMMTSSPSGRLSISGSLPDVRSPSPVLLLTSVRSSTSVTDDQSPQQWSGSEEEQRPVVKGLKRRNKDIYAQSDED